MAIINGVKSKVFSVNGMTPPEAEEPLSFYVGLTLEQHHLDMIAKALERSHSSEAERGIEETVKTLANEIHSAFANAYAINESISHEWLKKIIKNSFHQELQKAREEERERIFSSIENYFLSSYPIPDAKVMIGYINADQSELDQPTV